LDLCLAVTFPPISSSVGKKPLLGVDVRGVDDAESAIVATATPPGAFEVPSRRDGVAACPVLDGDCFDFAPAPAVTLTLGSRRLLRLFVAGDMAGLGANRQASIAAAGAHADRVWRVSVAGIAHAFERGLLSVGQRLAVKPLADRPGDRPWTRRYQYPIEDPAEPRRHRIAAGDVVAGVSRSVAVPIYGAIPV
jgi:hypothetical protein